MPSRSELKRWRALGRRKGREEHGLALAEGPRLLGELLDSDLALRHVLYTAEAAEEPVTAALLERAGRAGVVCEEVGERELAGLADTVTPQGILAQFEVPRPCWEDLAGADILVLDGVQDPGNVGTLLRTAEGLGLGGAVTVGGTVDPWNPKVVRASAGSVFRVPVVPASRAEVGEKLADGGWTIWAADAGGEPFRRGNELPEHVALVLGNEGSGVSPELLDVSARRVAIAMADGVDSLNVAVAAAILMDRIFSSRNRRC